MSLATRCTACGTIFRVVEDQLRVSDGWVRCGRCAEIFDAREMLFDIEREAPPPWPPQFTPAAADNAAMDEPVAPPPMTPEPAFEPPLPWTPSAEPEPEFAARADTRAERRAPAVAPQRQEPQWGDAEAPAAPDREHLHDVVHGPAHEPPHAPPPPDEPALHVVIDDAPPRPDAAPITTEPAEAPAPLAARAARAASGGADAAGRPAPVPEFMRRAERHARWNRPAVRWALAAAAVLLMLLLALQAALHFRDALAATHPSLRAPLQSLCQLAGCELKPWRRIEALSIDATSLHPVGSGANYRLDLSLRNKTGVGIAMPWVELSLTDANGAPLARRVFAPDTLTPVLAQLNAESEQALSLVFSTGAQRVSGYSVSIFYP